MKSLKNYLIINPQPKKINIVTIYTGSSIGENTIWYLAKNDIYEMILKGDILEILNFEKIKR